MNAYVLILLEGHCFLFAGHSNLQLLPFVSFQCLKHMVSMLSWPEEFLLKNQSYSDRFAFINVLVIFLQFSILLPCSMLL